jgi:hypothetical protein
LIETKATTAAGRLAVHLRDECLEIVNDLLRGMPASISLSPA